MRITAISDMHGHYPQTIGGDLLIIAGDLTARDLPYQYAEFFIWLSRQEYKKKILIAGNHDNIFQHNDPNELAVELCGMGSGEFEYLCDSSTEFEELKIFGSPWTTTFPGINPDCCAFTVDTDEELAEKWAMIPNDIDILVTHSPPWGILDKIKPHFMPRINALLHVGSMSLLERLQKLKSLKYHLFGHVHEAYYGNGFTTGEGVMFYNCSHVNERYQPVNAPINFEI